MTLNEAFSDLYSIASVNDTSVTVHLDLFSGSLKWNLSFINVAHDCEVDVLASFSTLLYFR
jgi:hypothetical protein